ncbi:HIR3 [Symbiodinium sp. KB8]|nr:HIR3 [Symbiodinium sp. KB8]
MQPQRGCLPGTNCCVNVPAETYVAVERFGAFQRLLGPGFGFAGLDICGACITFRAISTRVEEEHCSISTQTRDHEFITAEITIQYSVIPKQAKDAIYKLVHENFDGLMRSFLTGPVCAFLNRLKLEEVFGRKDEMTGSVRDQLSDYVRGYGFTIHRMEVTELKVCPDVMHAMNEAHKQRRARDTAELTMASHAAQKAQEATELASASRLRGERLAAECSAILEGLQDPQCKNELFSRFESVQIERAIRETSAQPLPDDMENIQELLKEPDDSEDSSLLASSRARRLLQQEDVSLARSLQESLDRCGELEEWGFSAGDEVELRGLSKLELNGQRGTVLPLEFPEQAQQLGRLAVMLRSGKQLSLKVGNLHKIKAEINTGGDLGAEWSASLHPGASRPLRAAATPGRELVVMTLNMQYLASFPQDPTLARRRLVEITSTEGLEGIDLFGQVGYSKLISSAVKAQPLRECLYDDPGALGAVPSVAHESLMVNELYLRTDDCLWEAQSTGVDQISSPSLIVAHGGGEQALVARSAVWARQGRHRSKNRNILRSLKGAISGFPDMMAFIYAPLEGASGSKMPETQAKEVVRRIP